MLRHCLTSLLSLLASRLTSVSNSLTARVAWSFQQPGRVLRLSHLSTHSSRADALMPHGLTVALIGPSS